MNNEFFQPIVPADSRTTPHPLETPEGMSRRELLERGLLGLLLVGAAGSLLTGCDSASSSVRPLAAMPPTWRPEDVGPEQRSSWTPGKNVCPSPEVPAGVLARSTWAKGSPIMARMNRADRPYDRITIHHDGMDAFTSTSQWAAAKRLESIRQAHLNRRPEPFGDIGYHYLIDPSGRVWQGRELVWQGAHVKDQNPGNLGICVMGNFNKQPANAAQKAALDRFVRQTMARHNISIANVKTHQERAPTECPGRNLQSYVALTRGRGMSATA